MMYDPEEKIKRLTILQRLLCNKGITALTTGLITLTPTVGLSATTRLLMWSQGSGTENLHVSKLVEWAMPTVRPYSRVAVGLVERKRYPTRFGAVGFRSSNQPTTLPVELAQALSRDSSSVRGRLDSNSFGLENGKYGNIHPFEGRAGEQITIEVSSGELELSLVLLSPDDNPIAGDNSSGAGDKAKITVTLPMTATYKIGVISSEAGETGNYTLSWREATANDLKLAEAQRLHQQAIQLYQQGEYATAIGLAQQALAIREKILPESHPDVTLSLNDLGLLYKVRGDYAKAEPLYLRSLAIREKVLDPSHPHVATSLNNLAGLYYAQGDYAKAEPLFLRSLAIREKALGECHPLVAESLNNLAQLYNTLGDYAKASSLSERLQEIRQRCS